MSWGDPMHLIPTVKLTLVLNKLAALSPLPPGSVYLTGISDYVQITNCLKTQTKGKQQQQKAMTMGRLIPNRL